MSHHHSHIDVVTIISELNMGSLRDLCKLAVLKLGISKTDLPKTVRREVEMMEHKLKSQFTGTFHYKSGDYSTSTLKIAWTRGEWQLTILNQETLRIRDGVEHQLGKLGGDLFLVPGRKVSISGYSIDWDRRKVIFRGKCSSSKTSTWRRFDSHLFFHSKDIGRLYMSSYVYAEEETGHRLKSRGLFNPGCFNMIYDSSDSESDSDSSVDLGD